MAAAIFDFWNREILLAIVVEMVETHQHTKFRQNRSKGWEDIKIFRFFSRWRPSAILDSFEAYLDHPPWVLGVSITLQNLVMIDAVIFIIWTFIYYLTFLAGKCLFTPPKLGFLGNLIPLMGCNISQSQKRHTLAWVRVIWAIKRENVVSGLTCRWVA